MTLELHDSRYPNEARLPSSTTVRRPGHRHPGRRPFRGTLIETTRLALLSETSLVFDTFQTVQTIREYDLGGGTVQAVREGVSVDRQPAYSPDGSRVIFTSNRSGNVDLFSWEHESGRLLQLTDHLDSDWDPAYTPDGESILFSSDRGGNLEIWMAEADGSNPRQVSNDGVDAENPTMTADGEWIVYSSGNPAGSGLFKIRPDGSDVTALLSGNWINPEVSPDGRYALTVTTDAGLLRSEIRVVEIATGELTDFSTAIEYDTQSPNVTFGRGRWLPDGSAIAYIGTDEQEHIGIWVQDFEPGRDTADSRRPLIEFRPDQVVETFGISPDGKRVAVSTLRTIQTLELAEGLAPLH